MNLELSSVVSTVNSLTLLFTTLSGYLIFNEPINIKSVALGSIFIVLGLYIMSLDDV